MDTSLVSEFVIDLKIEQFTIKMSVQLTQYNRTVDRHEYTYIYTKEVNELA